MGQNLIAIGFLVSFYEDDMSTFLLEYLNILYHQPSESGEGQSTEITEEDGVLVLNQAGHQCIIIG